MRKWPPQDVFAGERIEAHRDAEVEEVGHAAGAFDFGCEGGIMIIIMTSN